MWLKTVAEKSVEDAAKVPPPGDGSALDGKADISTGPTNPNAMQQDEGALLEKFEEDEAFDAVVGEISKCTKDRGEIRAMMQTYTDANHANRANTACP